jgi:hypothetical protein
MTLKVLDVNDPETVLVEPPKPDWMKKQDAEEGETAAKDKEEKSRWGKKKKDDTDSEDKTAETVKADNSSEAED